MRNSMRLRFAHSDIRPKPLHDLDGRFKQAEPAFHWPDGVSRIARAPIRTVLRKHLLGLVLAH
jgi:hypothetical protein